MASCDLLRTPPISFYTEPDAKSKEWNIEAIALSFVPPHGAPSLSFRAMMGLKWRGFARELSRLATLKFVNIAFETPTDLLTFVAEVSPKLWRIMDKTTYYLQVDVVQSGSLTVGALECIPKFTGKGTVLSLFYETTRT